MEPLATFIVNPAEYLLAQCMCVYARVCVCVCMSKCAHMYACMRVAMCVRVHKAFVESGHNGTLVMFQ